jgi:8-oxo-dGTP diphosphatase
VLAESGDSETARGESIIDFAAVANYGQMILRSKSETSADAARREMQEETGVEIDYLEQLMTFDAPDRDPRGRVFSIAYYALVRSKDHATKAGSDAREARWMAAEAAVGMPANRVAFDHALILKTAVQRLQAKVRYAPLGFNLLPEKFTLGELQRLYEAILFRGLDKRNFRKRILAMGILKEAGTGKGRSGPQAQLYRFDKRAYDRAVRDGFNFEI